MLLKNGIGKVEITVDETYTVDSTDNRYYEITLNPSNLHKRDYCKTLDIHIDLFKSEYHIALIGSYQTYDTDCAILEGEVLTVLQDDQISQINITNGALIRSSSFECDGCNFGIYKVRAGYLIYGELEITMLDLSFKKMWSFSGRDIFVSITNKQAFTIHPESISLYDFEDNYYEIDFNGKLITEHMA